MNMRYFLLFYALFLTARCMEKHQYALPSTTVSATAQTLQETLNRYAIATTSDSATSQNSQNYIPGVDTATAATTIDPDNEGFSQPKAVMFSCMDSRLVITQLLQCDVGDMFLVRNAGNMIPNSCRFSHDSVSTEPGALELGVIINDIEHVIVCGHSDCKAMNLLYNIKDHVNKPEGSPLELWLKRHGSETVAKFQKLESLGGKGPLYFQAETPEKIFPAYIDPENNFKVQDKFSQINTLQQLQNIASYSFLQDRLSSGRTKIHAMWFDIYQGDFYIFSRPQQKFVEIDEKTYEQVVGEIPE